MPRLTVTASLIGLTGLAPLGCTDDAEPSVPCSRLAPVDPAAAAVASGPTVLALADREGRVTVVRQCDDCADGELRTLELDLGERPDQIMLTSSGDWLVIRTADRLTKLDVSLLADDVSGVPVLHDVGRGAAELVGTLRSGDWIIFRNGDGLRAFDAGVDPELEPETGLPFPLGDDDLELRAVALGDRNLVARRVLEGGVEELYLVRVNPSTRHDLGGASARGRAEFLGRGDFSRVEISRGPSPASLGAFEPGDELPIDEYVAATSGEPDDPHTAIFRVSDAELSDRFRGAVVTSLRPLESLPGLSAVHPAGDRLAYITPAGSLALRSLHRQGACVVRSAGSGDHRMAGFSADGLLYFQATEDGSAAPRHRVFAHDPSQRHTLALTPEGESQTLAAVPSLASAGADGAPAPWAVTVRDGYFSLWAGDAAPAAALPQEEVRFLSRLDTGLWLLDAAVDEEEPGYRELELRRMELTPADGGAASTFAEDPPRESASGEPFVHRYAGAQRLCLSATRPGAWSTRCATSEDPVSFLRGGLPETEQPGLP